MSNSQSTTSSKWFEFPATYRRETVATLLHWVKLGESGVVIGNSGSGKSNIAGFVCHRPDVTGQLLPGVSSDYCFLHFDFNSLPAINSTNLYRALFDVMLDAAADEPALYDTLAAILNRPATAFDDPSFYLYRALQRAHQILIGQLGKQVIWLFDRFDRAIQEIDAATLNSLRQLRDQFKDKLCYITFTRYPLAQLRNPAEFDEFHEIMIMHTCWVGPMNRLDGLWVANQVMQRYKIQIDESIVEILYQLCGGLPAFLKIAYSAWAEGELLPNQSLASWQRILLDKPALQRNCQELWNSCTADEQQQLIQLENSDFDPQQHTYPRLPAGNLLQSGLVCSSEVAQPTTNGTNGTNGYKISAPLFAKFVRKQNQPHEPGIVIRNGIVYRDGIPLKEAVTHLEMRLLQYFCAHAGEEVCTKEDLDRHIWSHEHRESDEIFDNDQRLTALVKRLRAKLEDGQAWVYIHAVRGRGYQFKQPADHA